MRSRPYAPWVFAPSSGKVVAADSMAITAMCPAGVDCGMDTAPVASRLADFSGSLELYATLAAFTPVDADAYTGVKLRQNAEDYLVFERGWDGGGDPELRVGYSIAAAVTWDTVQTVVAASVPLVIKLELTSTTLEVSYWSGGAWTLWASMSTVGLGIVPIDVAFYARTVTTFPETVAEWESIDFPLALRAETTADRLFPLLFDMYPPSAFSPDEDGAHADMVYADADVMAFAQDDVDQLLLELFPQSADETLTDWEAFLGIDSNTYLATAQRQESATAAARAAQALTATNIREMLYPLLQPFLAFHDPCDDEGMSYRLEQLAHNGTITEGVLGQTIGITSPAQGEWSASTWGAPVVLLPQLVDRADDFTFALRVVGASVSADAGMGIVLFESQGSCYLFGPWDVGGTQLMRLYKIEADGARVELATAAVPAAPFALRASRTAGEFLFEYGGAGGDPMTESLTALATDVSTVEPRKVGAFASNDAAWNTVVFIYDELKLRYGRPSNNVELIEPLRSDVPDEYEEAIFVSFVHREPTDPGAYQIDAAQRLADRIKWGHALLLVGESDNFLTDDPRSLTDRDMLGR